jgi:hypothetical protein
MAVPQSVSVVEVVLVVTVVVDMVVVDMVVVVVRFKVGTQTSFKL